MLQATALPDLRAADFPTLRYAFARLPRTMEVSLVFRTAEMPDDVQTISLPWPGTGASTFDLAHVASWRGTITELGFYESATAQLVPPARGFAPFELIAAELWSPSWRGDLAALTTDWFGAWPWSQRSVHALGREGDVPRAHSALLFAALAVVATIAWAALLLGVRGRRLATIALVCAAAGWLALDLRWQTGLVQRLKATRMLYAGVAWPERERIVGDSDIVAAADALKALLRDEPPERRILVQAGSDYAMLRMIWHLLPLNAAAFPHARTFGAALPEDTLIVFYGSDAWRTDPVMQRLLAHSERITAPGSVFAEDFEASPFVVFRFHHAR